MNFLFLLTLCTKSGRRTFGVITLIFLIIILYLYVKLS